MVDNLDDIDVNDSELEDNKGEDDNFNVGHVDELLEVNGRGNTINNPMPHIFIEKKGITTHSLSIEIMPSLLVAEHNRESFNDNTLVIVKDSCYALPEKQEETERRLAQLNPQGNVVYLETGRDDEPLTLFSRGQRKGLSVDHVVIDDINIFRLISTIDQKNPVEAMYSNQESTKIDGKINIMLMDHSSFPIWKKAWDESRKIFSRHPQFNSAMSFRENQQNLDAGIIIGTESSRLELFRPSCMTLTPIHRTENAYSDNSAIPLIWVPKQGTRLELKFKK